MVQSEEHPQVCIRTVLGPERAEDVEQMPDIRVRRKAVNVVFRDVTQRFARGQSHAVRWVSYAGEEYRKQLVDNVGRNQCSGGSIVGKSLADAAAVLD
jgi:hypothetical protein